ncbi:hypothetical protein LshimejAT787_2400500 [Lyophyllum shimeji]|uniref:F-box domain-containing protein n=1 Tax=Lyophyllum shimeji TaxID=47721 RepID=A0A9P3PYU5_LYOSH|nr:hypothetical protein LshimejAT787_2400500 [Lyophyllum shimeji]
MAAALLTMFVPADIVYAILDELSSDPTSLKQCSLVAHSFRTHCHKLLFSHIVLNRPRQSRGLYRTISCNAALAGHIRTVEVVSTVADEFRGREWVTIEHTLAPLLQTLHSLQAFVFRSTCLPPLQWTSLPVELRQAILEISAPSITLRLITGVPMEPFGRLAGLRRLCLMGTASDGDHAHDLTSFGSSPKYPQAIGYLEALEIRASYSCGHHLVRTLTDPRSRLRISRLKALVLSGNGGFADKIIDAAGSTLERIAWTALGEADDGPFTTFPSSLASLPALSTKFARGHPHDPLPLLAHALSNLTPSSASPLTHLSITISFYGVWKFAITPRDVAAVDTYALWPLLDAALARPEVYPSLRDVTVVLRVGGAASTFGALARRRLGSLLERGVLRMVFMDK